MKGSHVSPLLAVPHSTPPNLFRPPISSKSGFHRIHPAPGCIDGFWMTGAKALAAVNDRRQLANEFALEESGCVVVVVEIGMSQSGGLGARLQNSGVQLTRIDSAGLGTGGSGWG